MNKKQKNTSKLTIYEEYVASLTPKQKKRFEEGYKELVLSELVIALMQGDAVSVRELAQLAKLSPTTIQSVRSGKKQNLTVQTLVKILNSLGYSLVVEKTAKESAKNVSKQDITLTPRFIFQESMHLNLKSAYKQ